MTLFTGFYCKNKVLKEFPSGGTVFRFDKNEKSENL